MTYACPFAVLLWVRHIIQTKVQQSQNSNITRRLLTYISIKCRIGGGLIVFTRTSPCIVRFAKLYWAVKKSMSHVANTIAGTSTCLLTTSSWFREWIEPLNWWSTCSLTGRYIFSPTLGWKWGFLRASSIIADNQNTRMLWDASNIVQRRNLTAICDGAWSLTWINCLQCFRNAPPPIEEPESALPIFFNFVIGSKSAFDFGISERCSGGIWISRKGRNLRRGASFRYMRHMVVTQRASFSLTVMIYFGPVWNAKVSCTSRTLNVYKWPCGTAIELTTPWSLSISKALMLC